MSGESDPDKSSKTATVPVINPTLSVARHANGFILGTTPRTAVPISEGIALAIRSAREEGSVSGWRRFWSRVDHQVEPMLRAHTVDWATAGAMVRDRRVAFWSLAEPPGRDELLNLRRRHVVVLGLGGVGAATAVALAKHGIGELTLVDEDRVEDVNLSKSFIFAPADAGALKTEVVARAVGAESRVNQIAAKPITLGEVPGADCYVWAGDDDEHSTLLRFASALPGDSWLISGGVNELQVVVGPMLRGSEVESIMARRREDSMKPISLGINPGTITTVNIAAAFMVHEIIRALSSSRSSRLLGRVLVIDMSTLRYYIRNF